MTVSGPEELWGSTDNPRYQEVQKIIASFEFLEPVLTRLKAGLPTSVPKTAAAGSETGKRYYTNERVGIKILLPPEWELWHERKASFAQGHMVVLGRPGTLANVWLVRDLLEASPDLYIRILEKRVIQTTDGYRKVSEEKVTRSGLEGIKILAAAKERNIKVRYWVEMFSVGNEHFRITASAPDEVFDRYLDTFEEMMSSVQFLPLGKELSVTGAPPAVPDEVSTPEAHVELGDAFFRQARWDEAIVHYRQALRTDPNDVVTRINLANALDDSGDTEGAIAEYHAAIHLDPDNAVAHHNLGVSYVRKKDWNPAEAEFRKAVRLEPYYFKARVSLAEVLVKKNDLDGGFKQIRQVIRISPKDAADHLGLNLLPAERQEFERAKRGAAARLSLGIMLKQSHDLDRASKEIQQAIRIDSKFALAHHLLGDVYKEQGKLDEAIDEFREAIRIGPDSSTIHYELGIALDDQGKLEGAIAAYREAIRIEPTWPLPRTNLGRTLARRGKLEEAIAEFRQAIQIMPNYAGSHNELAWLYATAKDPGLRNPVKALRYAKQAVELDGERTPAYLDTLAEAYYVNNQFDKAMEMEKKAISLKPDNKFYKEQLRKFEQAKGTKAGG